VVDGEIGVEGVRDAKKQSADRYVVETIYSRVKTWWMLQDRARWRTLHLLDHVWYIACACTDHNRFLRKPNNMRAMKTRLKELRTVLRGVLDVAKEQWPEGWCEPCYLQTL
jgi:hypothetical protein